MEIKFGREKYHLQGEMEQWCREHIGPGQWTSATPKTWEGMGDSIWVIHCMFGYTTFAFKSKRDYTYFLLRWI